MTPKSAVTVHRPIRRFAAKSHWLAYAKWLERHLRVSLALLPHPPHTALRAKIFDRWLGEGYTCEKVYFESLPGLYVTGNLFRPIDGSKRRFPAVLCPHGHWPNGRLQDDDRRCSVIARCIQLARMGAVVFSYDMVGYNDSCQLPHQSFESDPQWGLGLLSLQTCNSIRCIDFIQSLADVDPNRLGVTGCSGGGTQTFILGAVDQRVTAAAPVCMISSHMQGGCLCENQPLLRIECTNVDIARLFAPKPLFMGSCTGDWTCNTPDIELPAVRGVYRLFGQHRRVVGHHVDDTHNYNRELREAVYGFFNRHLFGASSARAISESQVPRPPLKQQMVWWGRESPARISFKTLRQVWRHRVECALAPHLKSPDAARKGLGPLLPSVLGITPTSVDAAQRHQPEGIRIHTDGDRMLITEGHAPRDRTDEIRFFSTNYRVPFAQRVHEVLAALEKKGGRMHLMGEGKAGLWCLFAAAVSPRVKTLGVDLGRFDPAREAAWARRIALPGIRQVGGLATAFALIGRRPLDLRHASGAIQQLARRYAC